MKVFSYENSQHIADFYTFSAHVATGILAYRLLARFWPDMALERVCHGTLTAVAWEIIENTKFFIGGSRCHRVAALSG